MESTKRLDRQEKLSKSWELVRTCRDIIKENYSSWQERKITQEQRVKLLEIEQEKLGRLEKAKEKQEKFKISQEFKSKDEAMRQRIILAEIKENAWKRRGIQSSHEEHYERLEKEERIMKREKVKEKIKQLEEERKGKELGKGKGSAISWKNGRKRLKGKRGKERYSKAGKTSWKVRNSGRSSKKVTQHFQA